MQIAAPLPRPVRRFVPSGNLRPKPLLLALLALLVLGGVAAFVYQRAFAPAAPAPVGQTVPVQRGNVAATVSATGSVVATKQAKLVFAGSGRVQEMLVKVGDQVTAGQALARLNTDTARLKLETAKSQLATAQLKLQQLTESASAEDLTAAYAAQTAAVAKLNDLRAGPKAADLQAAQSAVVQAQATLTEATGKLQTLEGGATPADRATAEAGLMSAQNSLAAAQAKLDQLQAGPTSLDTVTARTALEDANSSLRSAQAKLDETRAGAKQVDLTAAQAAFDKAQADVQVAKAKLDQVKATASVTPEVLEAQSTLAAAEVKLHAAHQASEQLGIQLDLAQANLDSQLAGLSSAEQSARATCDKVGEGSAECVAAKAKIDSLRPARLEAEQKINDLTGDGSWGQLTAQKELVAAQTAYDVAAANLKQVRTAPLALLTAQTAYDSALSQLTSARAKLDHAKAGPTNAELLADQTAVDQARSRSSPPRPSSTRRSRARPTPIWWRAQTAVDTAQRQPPVGRGQAGHAGPGHAAGSAVRAHVASPARRPACRPPRPSWPRCMAGCDARPTSSRRAAVSPAPRRRWPPRPRATCGPATSRSSRKPCARPSWPSQQAQIDLDGNTLLAPFDGVVASVAGQVGESSSSGTASGTNSTSGSNGFITLVDPKEVRVDVTVDETDVARIAVGKPAMVTFDALPNQPFRGQVVAISPSGSLSQGVVTYPVSINLDTRNQVIPAGLTASATIVIDQKDDTLLVPNRAVRRQGREQVVDVMGADGKPVTRTVRTGVQNDQMVEISEGLQEGDQVVIPSTTTRAPNVAGPVAPLSSRRAGGGGRAQVAGRWS